MPDPISSISMQSTSSAVGSGPTKLLKANFNGRNISVSMESSVPNTMVKLHEQSLISASKLGVKKGLFERKITYISPELMACMKEAQTAMWATKAILYYGSGNQMCDLNTSAGESLLRTESTRKTLPNGADPTTKLLWSATRGAGNCGEHASVLFTLLSANPNLTKHPIYYCSEQGEDHAYVAIGDPRVPEYGDNTIVVDAWPSFGSVHTLAEGTFQRPDMPFWKNMGQSHTIDYAALFNYNVVNQQDIEQEMGEQAGSALMEKLAQQNEKSRFIYQQWISSQDPSTRYAVPFGGIVQTFDDIPLAYLNYKLEGANNNLSFNLLNMDEDMES